MSPAISVYIFKLVNLFLIKKVVVLRKNSNALSFICMNCQFSSLNLDH